MARPLLTCPLCEHVFEPPAGAAQAACPQCAKVLPVPAPEPDAAFTPTIAPLSPAAESIHVVTTLKPAGAAPPGALPRTLTLAPPHAQEAVSGLVVSSEKYSIREEIARGGMGAILRTVDRDIRREVAMKVMLQEGDPHQRARFVEEAQVTGQLEHPNIVPVHELAHAHSGKPFFTMKLVHGRSLADILKALHRGEPEATREYTQRRLLDIFVDVCHAVAFAHSRSVIHRDLKPANVMLGGFGEVLVMDWGLAKVTSTASPLAQGADLTPPRLPAVSATSSPDESLRARVQSLRSDTGIEHTLEGTISGTPGFMSPEQARGEVSRLDARSDIYSLGAILYTMLALAPPVRGKNITEILANVAAGNIEPPELRAPQRNIPAELSAVAMKALALRPEDRYQRVEALRHDIELFLEGRAVSAKEDTAWETVVKLVKRNQGASIASGVAAVLLLAVLSVGFYVNLQERRRAEAGWKRAEEQEKVAKDKAAEALQSLTKAQEEERARKDAQRRAAPALSDNAREMAKQKQLDFALTNLDVALDYDPGLARARLLRAEVLTVQKKYDAAISQLETHIQQEPGDPDARRLLTLCRKAREAETPDVLTELADFFVRQGLTALAGMVRAGGEELTKVWRARLEEHWPGSGERLAVDKDGRCSLDLSPLTDKVTDLSPLKDMRLVSLNVSGTKVMDLAPLHEMPLEELRLDRAPVFDLGPLKGMALKALTLADTRVSDLTPLRDMPLAELCLNQTRVSSLEPLRGVPLKRLEAKETSLTEIGALAGSSLVLLLLDGTKVADLTPLKKLALHKLGLKRTQVRDLSPLKGMPLAELDLSFTPVSDLSPLGGSSLADLNLESATAVTDLRPLAGLPLKSLNLAATRITDLTPLRGMPLAKLVLANMPPTDLAPLGDLPRLTILDLRQAQITDLAPLKLLSLNSLDLSGTAVADLRPLAQMPLRSLGLRECRNVRDLAPLREMPLTALDLAGTPVTSLQALAGKSLSEIHLEDSGVTDLSPLKDMKLDALTLKPGRIQRGLAEIRAMNTVRKIGLNGLNPDEWMEPRVFWRKFDAGEIK